LTAARPPKMAPPPPTSPRPATAIVDYSRDLDRPQRALGSRYVDYLEQFVRMRAAAPQRAASDAAGGGGGTARGSNRRRPEGLVGGALAAAGGALIARPPDAFERPRRPVARYYPDRSWAGAQPWSWERERQRETTARWSSSSSSSSFSQQQQQQPPPPRAAAAAWTTSALTGAGALLLPPRPCEDAILQRRPNSARLPPGGMLLFDGGLAATATTTAATATGATATTTTTPRRAKHRPTATADAESGAAARALLRRDGPDPAAGEPTGSWAHWPATLRALPPGGDAAELLARDSLLRHRYSSDPWRKPPPQRPLLCADRAPSPCTTSAPDRAAAREAYADALGGYLANKRRAALGAFGARAAAQASGGAAYRYARFASLQEGVGGGASWSDAGPAAATVLLPPRVRAPTGAARPASPAGAATTGWGAAASARGTEDDGGESVCVE